MLEGEDDIILFVHNPIVVAPRPDGPLARSNRPPSGDTVCIYMSRLTRPWIMQAYHADASCHICVTRSLDKCLQFSTRGLIWKLARNCCLKHQARKTSRQTIQWPAPPPTSANSPGVSIRVDYPWPLPTTTRGNSCILLFTDRLIRLEDMLAPTAAEAASNTVADPGLSLSRWGGVLLRVAPSSGGLPFARTFYFRELPIVILPFI